MKKLATILALLTFLITTATAVEWEEIKCDVKSTPSAFCKSGDTVYIGHYGIAKSTDGGKTFKKINRVIDGDKEFDLADEGYLVWDIFESKNRVLIAKAVGLGILFSTNHGEIWNVSNFKLSIKNYYNSNFFEHDSSIFLLNRTSSPEFVLYKSDDIGRTWSRFSLGIDNWMYLWTAQYMSETNEFFIFGMDQDSIEQCFYYNPFTRKQRDIDFEKPKFEKPRFLCFDNRVLAYNAKTYKIYKYYPNYGWRVYSNLSKIIAKLISNEELDINIRSGLLYQVGAKISFLSEIDTNWIPIVETQKTFLYSPDFGNTWVLKDSISKASDDAFCKYESSTTRTIIKYRQIEDKKVCVFEAQRFPQIEDATNQNIFYTDGKDAWDCLPDIRIAWPNFDGSIYTVEGESLYFYDDFLGIQEGAQAKVMDKMPYNYSFFTHRFANIVTEHSVNSIELYGYTNREFVKTPYTTYTYIKEDSLIRQLNRNYIAVGWNDDGTYLAAKHSIDLTDYDNFRTENWEKDTVKLVLGDGDEESEKNLGKTFEIAVDMYPTLRHYQGLIDFKNETMLINHIPGIELSRDKGKTWTKILDTPREYINFKIHDDIIYLKTNKLLLCSYNGNYWENILEGTSKAKIIDFEFDPDGRAYVYTTNGAFISKESMEDSHKAWEDDKINLDFTVATDKKTVKINSSENIKSLEVSELKQRLECISDNTYDISNLESENYFLRVEFEDGKVVYKQLVLEEKK